MKKILQKILWITGILTGILAALYIGLSVYYQGGFSYGTWVNAVYCTGKTVSQINTELVAKDEYDRLILVLPDNREEILFLKDIGYQADYTQPLQEMQKNQNAWKWYQNLSSASRKKTAKPASSFDEKLLEKALLELEFVKEKKTEADYHVYLQKTSEGYVLVNEREQVLDHESLAACVSKAVLNRERRLDLLEAGCYKKLPLNEKMQRLLLLWEKVAAFQDCDIVYQFGEKQERVDASIVCDWLIPSEDIVQTKVVDSDGAFRMDEEGKLLVDREKLEAYVDMLAEKYDTVGAVRQFQATRGDVVEVFGGTYGNQIDRKAEKEYLYQAFLEKRHEAREPVYSREAWKKGTEDIGDTYIEVDMGTQKLYYYKEKALILESPIVTGDVRRGRETPAMVCYIYAKQKNRVLRGPGYASFVKYWMPVKGGIGIHDARWRKEFGGEIYLTAGSHGCINMPLEKAEQLFEQAEIGVPVVMFY